ncbi:MAG TPA: signal peptide peptidase SppA [Caulobacteraceae bacterium]|jgi:protease-4
MKQFLITLAGVFFGLVLFAVLAPMFLLGLLAAAARPAPTPARAVLSLDLRGALTDQPSQNPLSILGGRTLSVMGIETTLKHAESDPRVQGLFVRLPEGGMAPAAADELRLAFKDFENHGKFVIVHSQGLYADGMVVSTYELAAASGDVWMQPGAPFQATGIANEDLFFKRLFDRFGVTADFQQRYEYKNAVNPYLYDDYTPAHRTAELSWMGSVWDTALAAAAADRKMTLAAMTSTLEAGPWSAEDAKAKGLIDHVGEEREAEQAALTKAGEGAKLQEINNYLENSRRPDGLGPKIAVISAEGAIMTGRGPDGSPLSGEPTIRSDNISKAFYDAIDDSGVKAIVFRVSSPGGSDTASEQILAAVRAARAAGKPVVVSMGTYGASGGYWISSQASAIVAEPSTLTGSIGVFGGKFVLGPALAKWGVDVRGLSVGGPYASSGGAAAPMTNAQRAAFSSWMDRIYAGFVGRVADGRHLPVARVAEIARGRVWTGVQAKKLGLIDEVGGFEQAVDRAKALAGIKGEARLQAFGAPTSALAALAKMLSPDSSIPPLAGLDLSQDPQTRMLARVATDAKLRTQGATVLAPEPQF